MIKGELTRREQDVLVALCRPLSTDDVVAQPASVREIAAELVVTDAAVKQHLLHLYDKLDIVEGGERRRVLLAREAIRLGLVAAPERSSRQVEAPADEDPLASARASWQRHDWVLAAELFELAAVRAPLSGDDLVLQSEALLWANRLDESFNASERAYQAYLQAGAARRAGYVAALLTLHHTVRLEKAVARGWLARAEKLLEPEPECRESGYLAFVVTLLEEGTGNWDAVLDLAGRMEDIGRRHDDPDLQALGLTFRGLVATRRGSLEEGGLLLDEAMASAVAGELGVVATGVVYCRMLETCLALQDYRRAGEWTDAVDRCSHTTGMGGFPGDCGTHRTAVLVKRGSWTRGDEEGLRAFEDAQRFDLHHAGAASYELGAIRLRQGDLNAAEEAFVRAHDFGSSAQPGMALVQLARGETTAAATSIEDALEDPMLDALARAPLLLAKIEVELALGNLESLRDVADELEETARAFRSPALAAGASYASGAAELTRGDALEAMRLLAQAQRLWLEAEAPYEAARTRELLAQAQLAAGKDESSRLELRATRAAFERLGAPLDIERVERRLVSLGASPSTT